MNRELLDELCQAIDLEITAAYRNQARWVDLEAGACEEALDDGYFYSFKTELSASIPVDSPIILRLPDNSRHAGTWVGQNEFDAVVHLADGIGERVPACQVSADLTYILRALKDKLAEQASDELLESILEDKIKGESFSAGKLEQSFAWLDALGAGRNLSQGQAIRAALKSSCHFVWGPPGTGKTANLAQLCRVLADQNEKTIVLSHANAAIDVAALKIVKCFHGTTRLQKNGILRIGYSQNQEVRAIEEISALGALKQHYPDLVERLNLLEEERQEIIAALRGSRNRFSLREQLKEIQRQLSEIKKQLREAESKLIREAQLIIATTSKFVIDDRLWNFEADNVILDEASMLPFPFVCAAARRAKKRLLIFGDFRQLPPVCVSDDTLAQKWLGRDAFEHFGVQGKIDRDLNDARVTMLDTQYRMPLVVGDVVSKFSYGGNLQTDPASAKRAERYALFSPNPRAAVSFIDTTELHSFCNRENKADSYSRLNPLHALISVSLVENLIAEGARNIAVITPYSAQAKLLNGLFKNFNFSTNVIVSTIHRFQGAEMEIVIFDLTDALPQAQASQLTGKDVELSRRLLNVAISRTKGKLLVLADRSFIETFHNGRSPARKLLRLLQGYPASRLELQIFEESRLEWFDSWSSAQIVLYRLVEDSSLTWLSIPKGFELNNQLGRLLEGELEKLPKSKHLKEDLFFCAITQNSMLIGGRKPTSPIVVLEGGVKKHMERAIIGSNRIW